MIRLYQPGGPPNGQNGIPGKAIRSLEPKRTRTKNIFINMMSSSLGPIVVCLSYVAINL